MNVIFEYATQETPVIRSFFFTPEKQMSFIPGQFIELTLEHDNPDSRGLKRWFTISSSPSESLIGITTRLAPDASSFKNTLTSLKRGDVVHMSEPMGDFVLPKDSTLPLIFIAGGIGITPFHSIAEWLADHHESRRITLMHALHTEDDILFQSSFEKANISTIYFVSQPSSAWGGERGTLTADHVLKLASPSPDTLFYIAGPEQMTEALTKELRNVGIPNRQLITDYFPGYADY